MKRRIKGKVFYQTMEGGFWSIITDEGEKLIPTALPVQLQENDKNVECVIYDADDFFSIFIWGKLINIYIFVV